MPNGPPQTWSFHHFGLIVTGRGEEKFLPRLFSSVESSGRCHFEVIRRIGQRAPITSKSRILRMVGSGKRIPDRDEEIGLVARGYLQGRQHSYILLIDDLEHGRRDLEYDIFDRYREALDTMLDPQGLQHRAAVFFLVPMLETYYFAHSDAVNQVLRTDLEDHTGDVEEELRHPKGDLRQIFDGFDEIFHGEKIIDILDVGHVLARPETCSSLRTLFTWCLRAIGEPTGSVYSQQSGCLRVVTGPQLASLSPDP
jgi:hypothetical protein